ncbi:hypothetical protein F2Q69_00038675 [Brassica cretica]|uniref:Uncharacterized protein n=1 Tax=Brassica cretica TaxID=69181 RepID=A0A8S9SHY5_BRACR|nr:hypothetical protein F2Q69_00038675 [Brassica cretica]
MEILIIGSSVVAFVRPDLWLVFPDLVLLSRLYLVIVCFCSCSLFGNGTVYGVYWSCHLLLSDFAAFRGVMKINRS